MQVNLLNGMSYDKRTFNIHGGTNKKTGEEKLREDIKFLLTQEKGKFYPDPEFGSNLQKYLFEPMTPTLGKQMQDEIKELIEKYYPQIVLVGIDINLDDNNHGVFISIKYRYSDSEQSINKIDLALFNKVD